MKNTFNRSFWKFIGLFVILIAIICFFPFLFTRFSIFNLKGSGEIGDAIGGIMSPFIAICAALLTFLAFWVQYKANEQQALQFKNQAIDAEKVQVEKLYENLNKDIADAVFDDKKGIDAYLHYNLNLQVRNVMLDHINLILFSYEEYLNQIQNNSLLPDQFKKFHTTRLHLLFYSKVLWPLHDTITTHGAEFINGKHDDSKITLRKYALLGISCIRYLISNNLAADSIYKQENIMKLQVLLNIK